MNNNVNQIFRIFLAKLFLFWLRWERRTTSMDFISKLFSEITMKERKKWKFHCRKLVDFYFRIKVQHFRRIDFALSRPDRIDEDKICISLNTLKNCWSWSSGVKRTHETIDAARLNCILRRKKKMKYVFEPVFELGNVMFHWHILTRKKLMSVKFKIEHIHYGFVNWAYRVSVIPKSIRPVKLFNLFFFLLFFFLQNQTKNHTEAKSIEAKVFNFRSFIVCLFLLIIFVFLTFYLVIAFLVCLFVFCLFFACCCY